MRKEESDHDHHETGKGEKGRKEEEKEWKGRESKIHEMNTQDQFLLF